MLAASKAVAQQAMNRMLEYSIFILSQCLVEVAILEKGHKLSCSG